MSGWRIPEHGFRDRAEDANESPWLSVLLDDPDDQVVSPDPIAVMAAGRRRLALWGLPWIVGVLVPFWIALRHQSTAVEITYPLLAVFMVGIWLLALRPTVTYSVLERTTFWANVGCWVLFLLLVAVERNGNALMWTRLLPLAMLPQFPVFVLGYLCWDTRRALIRSSILPAAFLLMTVVCFVRAGREFNVLTPLLICQVLMIAAAGLVHCLARSRDALAAKRIENEQVKLLAYADALTGLSNRRHALETLEVVVADRSETSVVIMDLDQFKLINDRQGHNVGDQVLIGVAEVLRSAAEEAAIIARWGGEEFVIAVVGTPERALELTHRIRLSLAEYRHPEGVQVTASYGIGHLPPGRRIREALRAADACLYAAKAAGRDAIWMETKNAEYGPAGTFIAMTDQSSGPNGAAIGSRRLTNVDDVGVTYGRQG